MTALCLALLLAGPAWSASDADDSAADTKGPVADEAEPADGGGIAAGGRSHSAPADTDESAAGADSGPAASEEVADESRFQTAAPTGAVSLEDALGEQADPLERVARQIEAQEYRESITWLTDHTAGIESDSHRFDPRLVRPLTLLGDAHAGQGEHEEALNLYRRALHLNRVNEGLNAPAQVEIVYREAEALKALGQYQEANDREEYAYHVLTRAHDPLDEDLLPGLYHLAQWYERTSNVFAARALYERAMEIIEHHGKVDTAEAIPALRGIATSYRMERFPPFYIAELEQSEGSVVASQELRVPTTINNFPEGEEALQRVVRIQRDTEPPDDMALAESVLDLADWYTLFDQTRRAESLYAHAWELMSEVQDFDVVSYFAQPTLLYFPAPGNPSSPPMEDRGERTTGYVEVAFNVTDDGYVRDLDTIASQPDGLMDFRVRKSLRLARYRPMLVEGVPVEKESYTYRHEFPYYPEREPAEPTEVTAAAAANGS